MKSKRDRQDAAITNTKDYVDPARKRLEKKKGRRFASTQLTEHRRQKAARSHTKTPFTPEENTALDERISLEGTTLPRHERLGIMFIAVSNGVSAASKQFDVPRQTIYHWFREEGGFEEINAYVESAARVGFNKLQTTLYEEIERRMQDASDEELFESFRKLMPGNAPQEAPLTKRQRRERGESDGSPVPTQVPGVTLVFNTPSLPEGEKAPPPEAVDTKSEDDTVEGEVKVVDVFD